MNKLQMPPREDRSLYLRKVVFRICIGVAILLLVTGVVPQINILLFGDYLYNVNLNLRIVLIILTGILIFTSNRIIYKHNNLNVVLFIFIIYCSFTLFIGTINYEFSYSLQGVLMYFFIILLFALTFVEKSSGFPRFEKFFIYLALPLSVLAIVQHFTASSVLPIESSNGKFKVLSWLFWNNGHYQVRGYSLFSNAVDFGAFLIFCFGILLFNIKKGLKFTENLFYITSFVIFLLGSYSTLTRNIYVGVIISIFASMFYLRLNNKRILMILPLFSLIIGYIISNFGNFLRNSDIELSNSASLNIRQEVWDQILYKISLGDIQSVILGEGKYQSEGINGTSAFLIDNSFLQFLTYQGVIGLILFLLLYYFILKTSIYRSKSALWCGFYGFLVAWPSMAFFNILVPQLATLAFLTFFVDKFSLEGGVRYAKKRE